MGGESTCAAWPIKTRARNPTRPQPEVYACGGWLTLDSLICRRFDGRSGTLPGRCSTAASCARWSSGLHPSAHIIWAPSRYGFSALRGTLRRPPETPRRGSAIPALRVQALGLGASPARSGSRPASTRTPRAPGGTALGFGFVESAPSRRRRSRATPSRDLRACPRDRALMNRMGFNNHGAAAVAARLAGATARRPSWGQRRQDQDRAAGGRHRRLPRASRGRSRRADYLVVNVSSPNTPGLRRLQDRDELRAHPRPVLAEWGAGRCS